MEEAPVTELCDCMSGILKYLFTTNFPNIWPQKASDALLEWSWEEDKKIGRSAGVHIVQNIKDHVEQTEGNLTRKFLFQTIVIAKLTST